MIRFLIRTAIFFASAFVGIVAADLLLPGFSVTGWISYVWVAIVFALVQALISPMLGGLARRKAAVFSSGIGLVSTLVALVVTSLVTGSLVVDGVGNWVLAALVVWLFGAIAAFLLPFVLVKRAVQERRR